MTNTISTDRQTSYAAVDILKFFLAIGVVALHACPLKDYSPFADYMITQCITRIGVPFFFVAAGYFLFRKMTIDYLDQERIRKYVIRIFKMLVAWTAIYLPLIAWSVINNKKGIIWGILQKIWDFIFKGNAEFHLWFLHALIIAVVLIVVSIKRGYSFKKIFIIAGMLHLIALLGGGYYFAYLCAFPEGSSVYESLHGMTKFMATTNGFTVGFLYVAIGAYFGFIQPKFSRVFCISGCFLSWGLFITESATIKTFFPFMIIGSPSIFLIPATIFTFLLGLNIELDNKPIYMVMRKMSMYIYFVHPWFLYILAGISKKIYPIDSLSSFFIVILLTLITARMMVALSNKDAHGWLKVLG